MLGVAPERDVRTYRLIAGAVAAPTEEEKAKRAAPTGVSVRGRVAGALHAGAGSGPRPAWWARPLSPEDAQRAFVATLQRDLDTHLRRLRTGTEMSIDGVWDAHTEQAFQQVCLVLGIAPERKTRTFRIIAGAIAARTPAERERAQKDGAKVADKLQHTGGRQGRASEAVRCPRTSATARTSRSCSATSTTICCGSNRRTCSASTASGASTPSARSSGSAGCWASHRRATCGTYRIVAGALATRTDEETKRASADGVDYEKRLRELFAQQRRTLPQRPPAKPDKPEARQA